MCFSECKVEWYPGYFDQLQAIKDRDAYFREIGEAEIWMTGDSLGILFGEYWDWVDTKCAE